MTGVNEYVAKSSDFNADQKATIKTRLERKDDRYAVKGNSWQNVFPDNIRDYQDWWARVQAA